MWVSGHKANLTRILPHHKPRRRPAFGRLQFEAPTPGRNPGHPAWERVGDAVAVAGRCCDDFLVEVPTRLSSSGRSVGRIWICANSRRSRHLPLHGRCLPLLFPPGPSRSLIFIRDKAARSVSRRADSMSFYNAIRGDPGAQPGPLYADRRGSLFHNLLPPVYMIITLL